MAWEPTFRANASNTTLPWRPQWDSQTRCTLGSLRRDLKSPPLAEATQSSDRCPSMSPSHLFSPPRAHLAAAGSWGPLLPTPYSSAGVTQPHEDLGPGHPPCRPSAEAVPSANGDWAGLSVTWDAVWGAPLESEGFTPAERHPSRGINLWKFSCCSLLLPLAQPGGFCLHPPPPKLLGMCASRAGLKGLAQKCWVAARPTSGQLWLPRVN